MKVVMLEAPPGFLEERRRKGWDIRDELWDGVLHMVPNPSDDHQGLGGELYLALGPLAKQRGLVARYEMGVHRPGRVDKDYRVPDLIFCLPSQLTKRGVVGPCELVIEILSPHDETHEKIPFYSEVGVRELLIVDPITRALELLTLRRGRLRASSVSKTGVRSLVLGVTFKKVPGPKLRLTWETGEVEI
jgi:Uma2 family endonuclease